MLERRRTSRRLPDSSGGRRATDRGVEPIQRSVTGTKGQTRWQRIIVVGCRGVAGANMARFLKLWAGDRLDVTLVEPNSASDSHVPGGAIGRGETFSEFFPYDRRSLAHRYGIRIIGATVAGVDPFGRALILGDGTQLAYDRLEVAPGARVAGATTLER